MSGRTRVPEARSCLSAATKDKIHLNLQLISYPLEPSLFLTPTVMLLFKLCLSRYVAQQMRSLREIVQTL
jgi:hypothetical protein